MILEDLRVLAERFVKLHSRKACTLLQRSQRRDDARAEEFLFLRRIGAEAGERNPARVRTDRSDNWQLTQIFEPENARLGGLCRWRSCPSMPCLAEALSASLLAWIPPLQSATSRCVLAAVGTIQIGSDSGGHS